MKRASLLGENFESINDFILRNWGACVDTVFGHVPEKLVEYRSVGGKVMLGW